MKIPFKSTSGAKKAILSGYLFSLMLVLIGILWRRELLNLGFFNAAASGPPVHAIGSDAKIAILVFLVGGVGLFIYTVYITSCYLLLKIEENIPDTVRDDSIVRICPECLIMRHVDPSENSTCPGCGIELERLNGFLDRHPERLKKTPEKRKMIDSVHPRIIQIEAPNAEIAEKGQFGVDTGQPAKDPEDSS